MLSGRRKFAFTLRSFGDRRKWVELIGQCYHLLCEKPRHSKNGLEGYTEKVRRGIYEPSFCYRPNDEEQWTVKCTSSIEIWTMIFCCCIFYRVSKKVPFCAGNRLCAFSKHENAFFTLVQGMDSVY